MLSDEEVFCWARPLSGSLGPDPSGLSANTLPPGLTVLLAVGLWSKGVGGASRCCECFTEFELMGGPSDQSTVSESLLVPWTRPPGSPTLQIWPIMEGSIAFSLKTHKHKAS